MKLQILFILSCLWVYLTEAVENDCHPSALDELNLVDLLEKSKLSQECLEEAQRTFAVNYDKIQFTFAGPFVEDNVQAITEGKVFATLRSLDLIMGTLSNFGDMIDKIEINFAKIPDDEAKEIVKLINNKCSESLLSINLKNCKGGVLDGLKSTFRSVSNLVFSSSTSDKLQIGYRKLSEIFPFVKQFHVEYTRVTDWSFMGALPNLLEFTVSLPKREGENAEEMQIANFLRKNEQISTLHIWYASLKLLSEVNDILLNLESLFLVGLSQDYLNYEGEPIQLKRVRYLSIRTEREDEDETEIPVKTVFNHLNSLALSTFKITEKWMQFLQGVNPSSSLKKIHILTEYMPEAHFLTSSKIFPNMEEVHIDSESKLSAEGIVNFFRNSKQTIRMTLSIEMVKLEQQHLAQLLSNEWIVEFKQKDPLVEIHLNRFQKCPSDKPHDRNLLELLKELHMHPQCLKDIQETFKNNYLQTDFLFRGPFVANQEQAIEMCHDTDSVYVRNLNMIKKLLRAFGSQIYSIAVDFQVIEAKDAEIIVAYINDKCSDTLEVLHLLNCKGKVTNGLKNEFEYISEVKFSSSQFEKLEFDPADHRIQTIFPSVSTLHVEQTFPNDWKFIAGKLPKLRALSVQLPRVIGKDTINGSHISSLFMSNKKIRDLTIMHPTLKLLNVVNEKLQKLENLELVRLSESYLNVQSKSIEFKPLDHLLLRPHRENDIPKRIIFKTLEHFSLVSKHSFDSVWMQFIAEQIDTNLNGLNLKVGGLAKEHLGDIPKILPVLIDVEVECECTFMADDILAFVERSERLKAFRLKIQIEESEVKHLFEQLEERWNTKRYNQTDGHQKVSMFLQRKKEAGQPGPTDATYQNGTEHLSSIDPGNAASFPCAKPLLQMLAFIGALIFMQFF